MTVHELINELLKMPPNAEVEVYGYSDINSTPVTDVEFQADGTVFIS